MDIPDRTWPAPLLVADHLVPILRDAADDALDRACDNGGEWNDEIRRRVLAAARRHELLAVGCLPPIGVAELAQAALDITDPPGEPATIREAADRLGSVGVSWQLIELRDRALALAQEGPPPARAPLGRRAIAWLKERAWRRR